MFEDYDVQRPGPQLSEDQLASLEARFGFRFSDDFRTFLLWRNGGTPAKKDWPEDMMPCLLLYWPARNEGTPASNISFIFYFDDNQDSPRSISFLLKHKGDVPKNILPIGRDAGGDIYFMNMRENSPRVLYGPYLEPDDAAFVADGFLEFLKALKRENEV